MDVYARDGETIAVQVAVEYRNQLEGLKKALRMADKVVSACANYEVLSKLMELARVKLSPEELSRIQFSLAADFLVSDGN